MEEFQKITRVAGDNLTAGTLEQTTLLFYLMQQEGIFVNTISNSEMAEAISMLTGYDKDSIQKELDRHSTHPESISQQELEGALELLDLMKKELLLWYDRA